MVLLRRRKHAASNDFTVYVLQSKKNKKKVYVGMTSRLPEVRLREHNGEKSGGAAATTKHRPWEIAFTVTGFPTEHAALTFEYGLKNPLRLAIPKYMKGYLVPCVSVYRTLRAAALKIPRDPHDEGKWWYFRVLQVMREMKQWVYPTPLEEIIHVNEVRAGAASRACTRSKGTMMNINAASPSIQTPQ